jgi:hypothetical protein
VSADLILRPRDTTRPAVPAHLEVLAPLPVLSTRSTGGSAGDQGAGAPTDAHAASVDGAPITAGQLRELLEQLDAVCPGGVQAPTGGTLTIAPDRSRDRCAAGDGDPVRAGAAGPSRLPPARR